jgi:dihydropteroate synthase
MGVLNVTPNSFSDGGLFLDPIALQKQISLFSDLNVDIIDIGAESTAPFNTSIDEGLEKERLKPVLEVLNKQILSLQSISLDSYRPETAHWFFRELKANGYDESRFIWNDISGQLDETVKDFLAFFKRSKYVLCHNKAPTRQVCSAHMDYVEANSDIFEEVSEFFQAASKSEFHKQLIFDPCFGFSKNYEQNIVLIDRFDELVRSLSHSSWVFGISKKSFLRKLWQDRIEPNQELSKDYLLRRSELLHQDILSRVMKKCSGEKISFRVHDPLLYKSSLFLTAEKLTKN